MATAGDARPRGLYTMYALTFLFTLMMGTGLPLVPQFLREDLGASFVFIGIVAGVYGVMQVVLRLPMGDLSDQVGRRRSLIAAFVFALAGGAMYVWTPQKEALIGAQALFGFASGIFWVSANSFIGDSVAPAGIPRAMSHYSAALGFGFLVGPPLGGALADAYGYRAGLSIFLFASVAALVLLFTAFPADGPLGKVTMRGRRVYRRTWQLLKIPDLAFSAFGIFAVAIIFAMYSSYYPIWVKALGFTSFSVGVLFASREIFANIIRFALPGTLISVGPRRVLVIALVIGAITLIATPFLHTFVGLFVYSLIAGIGLGAIIPANLVLITRSAPAKERGLANGIYGTALGFGSAVAPLAFGALAQEAGLAPAFWLAGAVCLVGAVALWIMRHATGPAADAGATVAAQ